MKTAWLELARKFDREIFWLARLRQRAKHSSLPKSGCSAVFSVRRPATSRTHQREWRTVSAAVLSESKYFHEKKATSLKAASSNAFILKEGTTAMFLLETGWP